MRVTLWSDWGKPIGGYPVAREGHLVSCSHRRAGITALGVGVLVAAVCSVVPSASAATTSAGPLIRVRAVAQHLSTASSNWSGYAIGGTYRSVTGSWTVPSVVPSGPTAYSSTWIGVDGMADRDLIQTGTESDYVNGHVQYDAWWEILPASEKVIATLPVDPGDRMTASITSGARSRWTIVISDVTTGRSFTHVRTYHGPGASAEWVEERPELGRTLATLADYGSVTFTGLTANGVDPHLASGSAISMVNNLGTAVISAPSVPSASGAAFSVAYGPHAPPAPAG